MKSFIPLNSKKALVAAVAAAAAVAAVAAVALTSFIQVAQAGDVIDAPPLLTVHYSDLNLDTQAGAVVLYQRIRYAAEQVCGKADSRRLDEVMAAQGCMDKAIAASVGAVGNAQLTSQYSARMGKAPKPLMVASVH